MASVVVIWVAVVSVVGFAFIIVVDFDSGEYDRRRFEGDDSD